MSTTSSRGEDTEMASVFAAVAGAWLRTGAEACGAGRRSRRAPATVLAAACAVPGGSVVDSAGVPGPGVLCPPLADGRFSQYWLSALTVGGPVHPAPACAALAEGAVAAAAISTVIQTLPDIDGPAC